MECDETQKVKYFLWDKILAHGSMEPLKLNEYLRLRTLKIY